MRGERRDTPEIEITPEMIEAGLRVYIARLPDDASRYMDEDETVRLIYLAMAKVSCFVDRQ